ncbi:hypothetical protein BGW80DRAFT_1466776 [Lactifluus volemus]|nr:hypothetical protein BGW80DRAFT_1466776 [Lactifluus volemus]
MTDRERRDRLHLRLAAVSRVVLFAIAIDPNIPPNATSTSRDLVCSTDKAKWYAWDDHQQGTSKEEALTKYVEKLIDILEAVGTKEAKDHIVEINAA